jgi:hypothetical protein
MASVLSYYDRGATGRALQTQTSPASTTVARTGDLRIPARTNVPSNWHKSTKERKFRQGFNGKNDFSFDHFPSKIWLVLWLLSG